MTSFPMHAGDDHRGSYLWKSSLILALSLHGLIFLCALFSPFLLANRMKKLPEAYTVTLVSMPSSPQPAPAAAAEQPPSPPIAEEKPTPTPKPPSVPEPKKNPPQTVATPKPLSTPPIKTRAETAPPPPKTKDISLAPIKIKKAAPVDTVSRKEKLEKIEAIKKEHIFLKAVDAEQQTKTLENKAKQTAVENLRQMIYAKNMLNKGQEPAETGGQGSPAAKAAAGTGASSTQPSVMNQYLADVHQHIQAHWVLPPLNNWKNPLTVVLIIQIQASGEISRMFFEQKSANSFFNQFVLKTVKESVPLPRFPAEIREDSIEIGLRFKPGGLF